MGWNTVAEIVIGLLIAASAVPYLIDTFAGRTKPQRASWTVFAALAAAATASQVVEHGVTGGSIMTAVSALGFSVIAIVSIKYGVGGTSITDRIVLAGLFTTLGIWVVVGSHPIVLPLLIAVEIPAIVVTIVKVVRLPGTETAAMWMVEGGASLLAVLVAPGFNSSIMFPAYNATVNFAVLAAIWWTSPGRTSRIVLATPTVFPVALPARLLQLVPSQHLTTVIEFDPETHDLAARSEATAWADASALARAAVHAKHLAGDQLRCGHERESASIHQGGLRLRPRPEVGQAHGVQP